MTIECRSYQYLSLSFCSPAGESKESSGGGMVGKLKNALHK